jgi:AcrR family transcriptional regulator
MSSLAPVSDAEERRSVRKRRAIVEAATAAFVEHGYRGTSMDALAAAAGVSKQTVYQHFGDKERLFRELIAATVQAASDPVEAEVRRLTDSGRADKDLDKELRDLARRLLTLVLQPQMLRLRRLVIAESRRFPDLGRHFYDLGPGRTIAALAETFAELTRQGRLEADDANLAASQFNWLVMAAPLNQAMLLAHDHAPPTRQINKWADDGVRTFLAAYGNQHSVTRNRAGANP